MPDTAMTAPITSSLRSAERASHQETETGPGGGGGEAFPFLGGVFCLSLPGDGLDDFPFAFASGFFDGKENGVFNGMVFFGV
jgi:hypothetical protein